MAIAVLLLSGCAQHGPKKSHGDITIPNINLTLVNGYERYYSQEITIAQYRFFLDDLKKQGRENEYEMYHPDLKHWRDKYPYQLSDPYRIDHWLHPGYDNSPVTNIPHSGAQAFCVWLTAYIHAQPKLNLSNAKTMLPTEDDWIGMAAPFMDNVYPWIEQKPYDEEGSMFCNVAVASHAYNEGDTAKSVRWWTQLEPSVSFRPNRMGLYNVIGNAAELTCEGYIKGGSWTNTYEECALNKRQSFDLPHPEVGFRIIVLKDSTVYPHWPFSKSRRTEDCPLKKPWDE